MRIRKAYLENPCTSVLGSVNADGLEPIGRMTGNSECDECRALNIRDAIEILRKIDEKYIVNLRISRES